MKRRIVLLLVCCMLMCGVLTGCHETTASENNAAMQIANFKAVPEMEGVVYSVETRVMFYMISTHDPDAYYGYGYFGPYINENGRYCRYVDGKVVEIVVEDTEN